MTNEQRRAYQREWHRNNPDKAKKKSEQMKQWRATHPEYIKAHREEWRTQHPQESREHQKRNRYKTKYGLTLEEVTQILTDHGHCDICNGAVLLCIDHDHSTGQVRGVLCRDCNLALGLVKDDLNTLEKMIGYLLKFIVKSR